MDQQQPSILSHQLDTESTGYLSESAKWAKFISIIGFVFCALMVVIALFAGSIMASYMAAMGGSSGAAIGGGFFTVIYIVLALLWFFPCLYLYRFGTQMQTAMRNNELDKVTVSFRNLKSCFKFIGILLIVVLCFYALAIVGAIVASMVM